tara:strand:- start:840 stop:1487 length:648 start_codon:yes stop_codon:yes gene_type:complete
MKIEVIMDGARKGWTATPLSFRDLFDFHETMEDWPVDHEGPFTLSRSTLVVNKHVVHSRAIEAPITADSAFNGVWAVRDAEGNWIGYWRDKISSGNVHTAQTAIHPAHRGKGYLRTIMHMQIFLAFYVYKCSSWSFEVANAHQAIKTKVDRYLSNDNKVGDRDSTSTGAHVVKYSQTIEEQVGQYATVINENDETDGIRVTPDEPGYSNVFTFSL